MFIFLYLFILLFFIHLFIYSVCFYSFIHSFIYLVIYLLYIHIRSRPLSALRSYICRSYIFKASHLRTLISSHPYICRSYVRMFLCFACYVVRLRHAVCCLGTVMDDNKKERGKHKRYISIELTSSSLSLFFYCRSICCAFPNIPVYTSIQHVCLHARFFLTTFVTLGTSVV